MNKSHKANVFSFLKSFLFAFAWNTKTTGGLLKIMFWGATYWKTDFLAKI